MKKVMFTVRNIFMLTALSNQLTPGLHWMSLVSVPLCRIEKFVHSNFTCWFWVKAITRKDKGDRSRPKWSPSVVLTSTTLLKKRTYEGFCLTKLSKRKIKVSNHLNIVPPEDLTSWPVHLQSERPMMTNFLLINMKFGTCEMRRLNWGYLQG